MDKPIVNKPITMVADEFEKSLAELINNSHLPPFIVADKLRVMFLETNALAQLQLKQDRTSYMQSINSQKTGEKS